MTPHAPLYPGVTRYPTLVAEMPTAEKRNFGENTIEDFLIKHHVHPAAMRNFSSTWSYQDYSESSANFILYNNLMFTLTNFVAISVVSCLM